MELYGKPYIKENGTLTRISSSGEAYTVPAFEIRIMCFDAKRDVLVCGGMDYAQANEAFDACGYRRYGPEVPVTIH